MSDIKLTDDYTGRAFSHWWLYLLFGLNLLFLSVLIIIFPALLSLLVAGFLMADCVILLAISFDLWQMKRKFKKRQLRSETAIGA